ncbi:MAG: thiamine diphosphokinase [Chloroflexia bacterium]
MRALILCNGMAEELGRWKHELDEVDLIVAADGGARYARLLGLVPHFVVGDADSLDAETAHWLAQSGAKVIRYPSAKDETDLELALVFAAQSGASEILVAGAWGGRPDQAIANLQLLAHPALSGRRVRVLGADFEAFLVRGGEERALQGAPGETVSLLPFAGDVDGVRTSGLKWSLSGGTLRFGIGRGISNVLIGTEARISVADGLLLVVHLLERTR